MDKIKQFLDKYKIDYTYTSDSQYEECITGRFFMIHLNDGVISAIAGIDGGVDITTNDAELILSKLFPVQFREETIDRLL